MDHNGGGFGMRNWGYYEQPLKGNLGLQLMSSVVERDTKPFLPNGGFERDTKPFLPNGGFERDTKPFLSNGGFHSRDCSIAEASVPMELVRDGWISHRDNKIIHMLSVNPNYGGLSDAPASHTLQMLQPPDPPKDENVPMIDEPQGSRKVVPLKKRSQGPRPDKTPKPKKPKKVTAPGDETTICSVPRGRAGKKSMDFVINGIDLDILGIPTPVCSCTGTPQQCYRWGIGGWQSACCTTLISTYPLPMNTKRRGARIAGRKMSQGAFKKVLEKLAGEGYNLANPIDLGCYWAKHGTNKFVTIR